MTLVTPVVDPGLGNAAGSSISATTAWRWWTRAGIQARSWPRRNAGAPGWRTASSALPVLDLATFRRHLAGGATLVDTRLVEAWAAGHIEGALANPLRPQFASWLGGRVLDVRQDSEHAAGHLSGAAHVELGRLADAASDLGPVEAVMCGHGERAATAASLLERDGRPGVTVVVGGPDDWSAATGQELVRS